MGLEPTVNSFSDVHVKGDVFTFQDSSIAFVAAESVTIPAWKSKKDPEEVEVDSGNKLEFVTWGEDNKLPQQLAELIFRDPVTASNIEFKTLVTYGDGIKPVLRRVENNQVVHDPILEGEVYEFFENHDFFISYLLEQLTDLVTFYKCFPIIRLTRDYKVSHIEHAEASFCRLAPIDKDRGHSPYILYSSLWGNSEQTKDDIEAIEYLNPKAPLQDLKVRIGLDPDEDGKRRTGSSREQFFKYAVGIDMPSPGKIYYPKPYWYSIFDSGWFEIATLIPAFKKAILKNATTVKFIIVIDKQYFANLFLSEGIRDVKKQVERQAEEIKKIKDFLSGAENSGKAWITEGIRTYSQNGATDLISFIKFIPIENQFKGGEYLEDSEETSNMNSYAHGVHPSIRGAAPGKNKSINGTEARELFIIQNALMKPLRDLLLRPFRIAKAVNGWPKELDFVVPNIVLTTLDSGQGAKKMIGTNDKNV